METLELEKKDGVAVVHLDRPPVNAVNHAMMRELRTCFDELSQDRDVAAVVFAARGERAFCGGIDLKELSSRDPSVTPSGPCSIPLGNGDRPSTPSANASCRCSGP